jgi:hypothetical protein
MTRVDRQFLFFRLSFKRTARAVSEQKLRLVSELKAEGRSLR